MTISPEVWRLPLRRRDPVLRNVLEQHADQQTPAVVEGVASELRRLLVLRLPTGNTDIESVARALATTPRTLQRRLAAQHLSYNGVLESTRRIVAEGHLADRSLSIAEVSYLAGYSEPAAFHRAFKRWTKQTPQTFRRSASGTR
jgi:AraC-like DNA-binding protein